MLRSLALFSSALVLALAGCDEEKKAGTEAPAGNVQSAGQETAATPVEKPAEPGDSKGESAEPKAAAAKAPGKLYYEREITPDDLKGRSLRDLTLIRNTIYARAGNTFRKKWLREHFEAQPWYRAKDKIDESKLSKIDHVNAKTLAIFERALSPAELDKRKTDLLAGIGDGKPSPEQTIELKLISARIGSWVGPPGVPKEERTPLEDPTLLDKEIIEEVDVFDMSRRDLRILRNMIYARRGRPFKSKILRQYFAAISWYKPDPSYTDKRLTKVDWINIRLIKSMEKEMGGPLTENRHTKILTGDEEDDFFAAS